MGCSRLLVRSAVGATAGVPLIGWVESSQRTGQHRGAISSTIRRRFLRACSAAIVPGASSEAFVRRLAPALPCHHAPNSVDAPDLRAIGEPSVRGAAVFIGELSHRKGVDLILAAAPQILQLFPRRSWPATARCVLTSSPSPPGCPGWSTQASSKALKRRSSSGSQL